jgi:hypothetical protein
MKPVIDFIMEAIDFVAGAPFGIQFVACILAFLVVFFVSRFGLPAVFILFRLGAVVRRLQGLNLKRTENRDPTPIFARGKTLTHLWSEYQDTLHEQRELVLSEFAPASITEAGSTATLVQATSRMAITVAVRRRNWSLRVLAEVC